MAAVSEQPIADQEQPAVEVGAIDALQDVRDIGQAQPEHENVKPVESAAAPAPSVEKETGATNVVVEQVESKRQRRNDVDDGTALVMQQMLSLHRHCVDGDVMGVRAVLTQNMALLESIDPSTGLTPMLQAIYNNQVEVVKELMMAGAFPPPPAVTSDPTILSILFPRQTASYPSAPTIISSPTSASFPVTSQSLPQSPISPNDFVFYQNQPQPLANGPVQPVFPQQSERRNRMSFSGPRNMMDGGRKDVHLPPADVSRQIPCRNFPNCKYGENCAFYHPQPFYQPAYPTAVPSHIPNAFQQPDGSSPLYYNVTPPSINVPAAQSSPVQPIPETQSPSSHNRHLSEPGVLSPLPMTGLSHVNGENTPSPASSAVPSSHPGSSSDLSNSIQQDAVLTTPLSPIPNPLGSSAMPHLYYAPLGPAAGQTLPLVGQPFRGITVPVPPYHVNHYPGQQVVGNGFEQRKHLKRMSLAGGKSGRMGGQWINGQPPLCVFFQANKCRNGEMCKFAHILPDGSDCRHPDVINGSIPPAPSNANNFRQGRMPRASFTNGYHSGQQLQALQKMQDLQISQSSTTTTPDGEIEETDVETKDDTPNEHEEKGQELEQKVESSEVSAERSAPVGIRSVPNTRPHSPNRHVTAQRNPRFRSPTSGGGAQAARASSIPAAPKVEQRVPGADEFPALSGSVSSLSGESTSGRGVVGGKTAAQVLAAPAPVRSPQPQAVEWEGDAEDASHQPNQAGDVEDEQNAKTNLIENIPIPFASISSATAELEVEEVTTVVLSG